MPRKYSVVFENVAVTAAQDLVELKGAAGKTVEVLRAWVGAADTSLVTAQSVRTRCRYLPATVTDGSGGTAPTPQKMDPGDSAASATALANSTTQATTTGTAVVVGVRGDHIYAGTEYTWPEGKGPVVGPAEAFTFELLSTVSGTVHLSGGVEFIERGG